MGLLDFQIIFEKEMPIYFPGEVINGQLVVNLSSEKKMAKIIICYEGKGDVWWKQKSKPNSKRETEYSANETYFNYEVSVYNGPKLPPGIHKLPFMITLPQNIPGSYESEVGHIRYEIKAQIVRDWKWDHKVERLITVSGMLDLNVDPANRQPGQSHNHKALCCTSGLISAIIRTNRSGYVPGEMIGFNAEVDNKSRKTMNQSKLQLVQHIHYMTPRRNKTKTHIIAEFPHGSIGPGESDM